MTVRSELWPELVTTVVASQSGLGEEVAGGWPGPGAPVSQSLTSSSCRKVQVASVSSTVAGRKDESFSAGPGRGPAREGPWWSCGCSFVGRGVGRPGAGAMETRRQAEVAQAGEQAVGAA